MGQLRNSLPKAAERIGRRVAWLRLQTCGEDHALHDHHDAANENRPILSDAHIEDIEQLY
jgi:hypothetical protein